MRSILIACVCALALSAPAQTAWHGDVYLDGQDVSYHGVLYVATQTQTAKYRHDGHAPLNDLKATPGAVDPALTKAVLCDPAHHTSTDRHVTQSEKVKACLEYGIKDGCPGPGFELDHLISIEISGSNDITNLWPQPVDAPGVIGFHTKDVVENRSHAAVCSGKITLKQAQDGISTDWYKFGMENGFITK